MARLVLGTAQLDGLYGLVRAKSKEAEPLKPDVMLMEANRLGIYSLDTAPSYGRAEQLIGRFGWSGAIATKVSQQRSPQDSIALSLKHLQRDEVDVVYVHDYSQTASKAFLSEFISLRGHGARLLGASVYEVEEFQDAVGRGIFDVLQFPLNIFDRRFIAYASGAAARGIRLVARSALLQGLLSSPGLSVLRSGHSLQPFLRQFEGVCQRISCEPQIAAVSWTLNQPFIDQVIIGFDSVPQMRQVVGHVTDASLSASHLAMLDDLAQPPRHLVDPRVWTR